MLSIPSDIDWRLFLPSPSLRAMLMPRPMTWREHIAAGLILLAQKLVGFSNEEDLARVARATRGFETGVGANRVPQGRPPADLGFQFWIGKTSGAIAKGATNGTVTIWDSSSGASSIAATSATLTNVFNPFADVGATKYVLVIQLGFSYVLCAAEC